MTKNHTTDEFLQLRGIDRVIWEEAPGCRRYAPRDKWVTDALQPFYNNPEPGHPDSKTRLGAVTRFVNESPGWSMPEHAPEGFAPIPPQLRPDKPIVPDKREVWHHHGARTDTPPTFPTEAGSAAGKFLPKTRKMYDAAAESHINSAKYGLYDPETGLDSHCGANGEFVHRHAPHEAKYILQGKGSRIDLHPLAAEALPDASVVFVILEGTPKTDATLSARGGAFGVPSVTGWTESQLLRFSGQLHGKAVLVLPDADWFTNWQVERQALKIRTVLRRQGIESEICAPPHEDIGGQHKGIDDFFVAGFTLADLVISGREAHLDRVHRAVSHLANRRKQRAAYALENLALYCAREGKLRVVEN